MTDAPHGGYTDPAELLAVVDEHDREIGAARRDDIHRQNLLHRAIHLFVFSDDGRLLLQQRSHLKDCFPLHWECVGGHLSPGESYEAAAPREAREELGIDIASLETIGYLSASPATGHEFIKIFRCIAAAGPRPNPYEIIDTCWFSRDELLQEIAMGRRLFSPVLLLSLKVSGLLSTPW